MSTRDESWTKEYSFTHKNSVVGDGANEYIREEEDSPRREEESAQSTDPMCHAQTRTCMMTLQTEDPKATLNLRNVHVFYNMTDY